MRLVCPNCGAQYDVPLEVIPEAGRDVQCSSCGHTWFQKRVAQATERPRRGPEADTPPSPAPAAAPKPAAVPEPAPETAPEPPTVPDPAPKRSIDPEMAELFREEREYEARRRASEPLETQAELGLTPPDEDEQARRARESRERMAKMRGDKPETPMPPATPEPPDRTEAEVQAAAAAAASRRGLLPDVEEINQTLRATSEPRVVDRGASRPEAEPAARETGSPFARGFMLMVLLAVLLVAGYVLKPKIVATLPQAEPILDAYTDAVDRGRLWLDETVTALLVKLDSLSSEAEAPADPAGN
ncbi:zinc-ribbon domain-containing protein [Maliponia aquimaris]|uniref:Zinc finger/thioredoxin putative domain-containing protein n=1 Tax=Maliponia aquimaris TaxID=1673631 RepID=A0A238KYS0_9RHOB|nr:zinc-ribbon domain-containing protein [Maliponia aquimaris]SMX47196.1 hypothetical protein MAA8898_03595 [Maliponia aquimaris]